MKEFAYKLIKGIARKDIPRDKRDIVNDLIALKIVSDGKIIKLNYSIDFTISPTLSIIKPKIESAFLIQILNLLRLFGIFLYHSR